jgi:hypothetical protein
MMSKNIVGRFFALVCLAVPLVLGTAGCGSASGGGELVASYCAVQHAASGQGLIAIDDADQVAVAPIFTLDNNGNAQAALINLSAINLASAMPAGWWRSPTMLAKAIRAALIPEAHAVPNPIVGFISLLGSTFPIAAAYDSIHHKFLVEASASTTTGAVTVYQLDINGNVDNTIAATGLTQFGTFDFGGIIFDPLHNRAIVGGEDQLGLLNTANDPPTWDATTITQVDCTDSFSLNFNTQTLFVACDGTNQFLKTSTFGAPMPLTNFQSTYGTTDGNYFDSTTNIVGVDPEFQDVTRVFNFTNLDTSTNPATAPEVDVPGLGTTGLHGEGPGGQLSGNTKKHQLFVLDEFGENFRLIQLPMTPINGPLNNNGQPGSMHPPDAASAYTIAASVLPMVTDKNSNQSHLSAVGDPNSATVDSESNHAFLLATDDTCQLWMVVVDLNNPTSGGCVSCGTQWTPPNSAILMSTTAGVGYCG